MRRGEPLLRSGRASSRERPPYYAHRARLQEENLKLLDPRTIVSRRWRYVCVRVPKAANSTVVRSLVTLYPEDGIDPTLDVEEVKRRLPSLGSLSESEVGGIGDFFHFTVVRNPYARTLSAYLDKLEGEARKRDRYGERVAAFDGGTISFRGFCRYLQAGGHAENAHWTRQTRLVGVADRMDFVGKVETLGADLPAICARIGGRSPADVTRDGPRPTRATDRMEDYYDDECRALVAETFHEDFERFGYAFALPENGEL